MEIFMQEYNVNTAKFQFLETWLSTEIDSLALYTVHFAIVLNDTKYMQQWIHITIIYV
jgi:hypothetical protein